MQSLAIVYCLLAVSFLKAKAFNCSACAKPAECKNAANLIHWSQHSKKYWIKWGAASDVLLLEHSDPNSADAITTLTDFCSCLWSANTPLCASPTYYLEVSKIPSCLTYAGYNAGTVTALADLKDGFFKCTNAAFCGWLSTMTNPCTTTKAAVSSTGSTAAVTAYTTTGGTGSTSATAAAGSGTTTAAAGSGTTKAAVSTGSTAAVTAYTTSTTVDYATCDDAESITNSSAGKEAFKAAFEASLAGVKVTDTVLTKMGCDTTRRLSDNTRILLTTKPQVKGKFDYTSPKEAVPKQNTFASQLKTQLQAKNLPHQGMTVKTFAAAVKMTTAPTPAPTPAPAPMVDAAVAAPATFFFVVILSVSISTYLM